MTSSEYIGMLSLKCEIRDSKPESTIRESRIPKVTGNIRDFITNGGVDWRGYTGQVPTKDLRAEMMAKLSS